MFRLILSAMIVGMLSAGPAWALFETNKELVASAKIPLDEAVKSAVKVVPGKGISWSVTNGSLTFLKYR